MSSESLGLGPGHPCLCFFVLFCFVSSPGDSHIQPSPRVTTADQPIDFSWWNGGCPQRRCLREVVGTQETQWPRQGRNPDFLTPRWGCGYLPERFSLLNPRQSCFLVFCFFLWKVKQHLMVWFSYMLESVPVLMFSQGQPLTPPEWSLIWAKA